jgi:hypothetical protein
MAILHSLLALYGALDDAVGVVDDPQVTATVDGFLPGTTGPDFQGWFDGVRNLVRGLSIDPDQTEFPTRTAALQEFARIGSGIEEAVAIGPVETAKLLYVIGPLWQLSSRDEEEQGLFAGALSAAVAREEGVDPESGGQALLGLFISGFNGIDDFRAIVETAADAGLVSEAVRSYVRNSTLEVDIRSDACGEYAVLKATYFHDELPLVNVKEVVDPLNWHRCCPFFCDMKPIPTTPDSYGWSRVLEAISTLCGAVPGYRMKTAIKYWKGEKPGGAFVNYDLDDHRADTPDQGLAVVDRGYISFEQEGRGVRVRTLKEVRFAGVPTVATVMFAIIGGYASIGESMLLGCAQDPPANRVGWQVSQATGKQAKAFDPTVCTSAPASPAPCGCTQPVHPAFAEAVDQWTGCVTEVSTEYAALVNRWVKCGFEPTEMMDFGARVSARLATEPWRFWGAVLNGAPKTEGQ